MKEATNTNIAVNPIDEVHSAALNGRWCGASGR